MQPRNRSVLLQDAVDDAPAGQQFIEGKFEPPPILAVSGIGPSGSFFRAAKFIGKPRKQSRLGTVLCRPNLLSILLERGRRGFGTDAPDVLHERAALFA